MNNKILIVEDDSSSMYMLSFMLKSNGYEVFEAFNGKEGLDMARDLKPYAVLLDIQMPEINGLDVTRILKEDDQMKSVPVIILTSFAMPGDKSKALEAGADGYIEKPIDTDTFIPLMESIIASFFQKQKRSEN